MNYYNKIKEELINNKVNDFIKNPVFIKNSYNYKKNNLKNIKTINIGRFR